MSEQDEFLMQTLDETAKTVAAMTGMKAQFVNAGWNEHNAEKAVLAIIANASGAQAKP